VVGNSLGQFEIVKSLGSGGMGDVYQARDTTLGRDVAIKVLHEEFAVDADRLARLRREARLLASLNHPNIAAIHSMEESQGTLFLVLELVKGESLERLIANRPLSVDEVLEIGGQVAEALEAAHEAGIIHRDLKPANVMVTPDGRAKVLDFGIAKTMAPTRSDTGTAAATGLTVAGTLLGTAPYMSPEQVRGKEADQRSDIWAFGCLLFEMLAREPAFVRETVADTLAAIVGRDPDWSSLPSETPAAVRSLLRRCLHKDWRHRLRNIGDAWVEIEEAAGEPAAPAPAAAIPSGGLRARWLVAGMAGIVAAGILGYSLWSRFIAAPAETASGPALSVATDRKPIVVLPFENLGPPGNEYFAAGITEEITSHLARIPALRVISGRSAAQVAEGGETIGQIGEGLGVDYVLEGTVRWAGTVEGSSRVRISPKLIRVADDAHIWTRDYEAVLDDIFRVQMDVANDVSRALDVALSDAEGEDLTTRPTDNLDAYQAYLRGRQLHGLPHFTMGSWTRGLESFQLAVDLDPGFAAAWAALAAGHARLYFYRVDQSEERRQMSRQAAERAVELEPDSAESSLAQGYYRLWVEGDAEGALEWFDLAAQELPDNAEVLQAKGGAKQLQGDMQEALDYFRGALELSPLQADIVVDEALTLWWSRRYPEALEVSDKAISMAPGQVWPYLTKAFNYFSWTGPNNESRIALEAIPPNHEWAEWSWFWQEMGERRYEQAIERLTLTPDAWIRHKLYAMPKSLFRGFALELLGQLDLARSEYESALEDLQAEVEAYPDDARYRSSLGIAYAVLGRKEEAIREGELATELRPSSKDAIYSLSHRGDLAYIYALVGETDAAIDELENLLAVPGWFSVSWLRTNPRFDLLRDDPGFQELLEKHGRRSADQRPR
jgi:TolB-like protein/Flp pilus assembly protein TadD